MAVEFLTSSEVHRGKLSWHVLLRFTTAMKSARMLSRYAFISTRYYNLLARSSNLFRRSFIYSSTLPFIDCILWFMIQQRTLTNFKVSFWFANWTFAIIKKEELMYRGSEFCWQVGKPNKSEICRSSSFKSTINIQTSFACSRRVRDEGTTLCPKLP